MNYGDLFYNTEWKIVAWPMLGEGAVLVSAL